MATKEIMAVLATNGNTEGHTIDDLFSNKFCEEAKDTHNIYYIKPDRYFYKVGSDDNPNFDQTQDYTTGILCVETGESYERLERPPPNIVLFGTPTNTIYKKIITADGKIGWMLSSASATTPPYPRLTLLRADLVKEICSRGRLPNVGESYARYIARGQLRKKKQKAKRSNRSKRSKSSKHSKRSKSSKKSKSSKQSKSSKRGKRSKKPKKRNTKKKSSKKRRTKRR